MLVVIGCSVFSKHTLFLELMRDSEGYLMCEPVNTRHDDRTGFAHTFQKHCSSVAPIAACSRLKRPLTRYAQVETFPNRPNSGFASNLGDKSKAIAFPFSIGGA
jgi:hypothetical protein